MDVGLGADVDALGRLVEHQHGRRDPEPPGHDDLLLVAARQLRHQALGLGRPDVEVVHPALGLPTLCSRAQQALPPERGQVGERQVLAHRGLGEQALHGPIGRHAADACPDRRPRIAGRDDSPVDLDLATSRKAPGQQPGELLAPRPGQPGDAEDLARANLEVNLGNGLAKDTMQHETRRPGVLLLEPLVQRGGRHQLPAEHQLDQRIVGKLAHVDGANPTAVTQDRDLVGEAEHLVEVVGDEQNGGSAGGDAAQGGEEPLDLGARQRRGRLVEHQQRDALEVVQGPGDGHGRAFRLGQRADHRPRRDVIAEGGEGAPCVGPLGASVQGHQTTPGAGQAEVVRDAHALDQPEVLMHEAQAGGPSSGRGAEREGLPGDLGFGAGVGLVVAGEDLDESRLAAAVLSDQRVDLARGDLEIDPAKRPLGAKGLRHVPDS